MSSASRHTPSKSAEGQQTWQLGYEPPLAWQRILDFLQMRAIPKVETVHESVYYRTAHLQHGGHNHRGWLFVKPDEEAHCARVTLSPSLVPVAEAVLERVRHLFDLDRDPAAIAQGLEAFNERFPGRFIEGTRLPGCFDAFETSVRAILGQQISVKGASTIAGRVAAALGAPVKDAPAGLECTFPTPADIVALGSSAEETLGVLGVVRARTRTIMALAESLCDGRIDLAYGADPSVTIPALEALPGIGPWTAHYIAMRVTGYSDAFPSTDLGVKKALAPLDQRAIEEAAEDWRPWRAYATMSLWSSGHH